jgi:hypothetical protein
MAYVCYAYTHTHVYVCYADEQEMRALTPAFLWLLRDTYLKLDPGMVRRFFSYSLTLRHGSLFSYSLTLTRHLPDSGPRPGEAVGGIIGDGGV